ncbi:NADPH-dependent F420 reductase [Pseudomonas sp. EA_105y_Pfl2_R69]|uniref:NADPH-dependent F420 reductase n=1 Tax=Pseudomonas sp. EA_105y_Pfl2_R69 TaxID=3088683 RepID=UPI00403FB432
MKIGILGSGRMGGNLGTLFARLGHDVTFSYSRSTQRLDQLAQNAGAGARAATPSEAVTDADVILLAVHWTQVEHVLGQSGTLAGKVVISCCNPLNAEDTELVIGHTISGAETLAARLPDAHIVAAFQATPSEVMFDVFAARDSALRPSLIFCGDDAASKTIAADLISAIGFDPVDVGALRIARYIEPFAMLSGVLAYETDQGPEWAYRFARFDRLFGLSSSSR